MGLSRSLTSSQAIALAITTIVGSGLLVLPGIAYQQVGNAALYAWIINALLVLPLLVIYAYLGSNFPSAGGVAGFVQAAFSRPIGAATETLLLGTFVMGGSAIALTGGHYFSAALRGNTTVVILATFAIVAISGLVNYQGIKISGRVQQFLAISLVGILAIAAFLALMFGDIRAGEGIAPLLDFSKAFPIIDTIFFAFTGFEMLSFTTEEYKNPKRDFPIAVLVSYIIVVLLYIVISLAVQLTLPRDNPELGSAPIAAILAALFGRASGQFVALVGTVIILSNLIAGSWAASRLVFSSSREGLLPSFIGVVESRSQVPRVAVILTMLSFTVVCGLNYVGVIPLSILFSFAGQGFFAVNALSALAYLKLTRKRWQRTLGIFTLILVFAVMGTFGEGLVFVFLLMGVGVVGNHLKSLNTSFSGSSVKTQAEDTER
jgi:amino acid efflux transporter